MFVETSSSPPPQAGASAPRGAVAPAVPVADLAVVVGISPVYSQGLCTALGRTGLRVLAVRGPRELELALPLEGVCVAVAPQAGARALLAQLAGSARARVRLVLLLADDEPATYLDGLRAGALSLVPAGARPSEVIAVVSGAARGYTCLPPAVVRSLCRTLVTGPPPELSARERAWLRQIADGVTVVELAARSACSEREMYRLLGAVYRRLGARTRTEALFAAQRSGLLGG